MKNRFKVWLGVGITVVLALSVLTSAVWAQAPQPPQGQVGEGQEMMPPSGGQEPGGMRGRGHGPAGDIAELLGITAEELRAELDAGNTLAEIAASYDVTIDELVEAIVAPQAERLAAAVEAGNLTQEQADYLLADMTEHTTWQLENGLFIRGAVDRPAPGEGEHDCNPMADLLELLGLTQEELRAEFEAGKTLLEIATEQGISTAEVVEVLTASHAERLAEAVANGDLTQAQADYLLAHEQEIATWKLENGLPLGRGHGHRGGQRPPMPPEGEAGADDGQMRGGRRGEGQGGRLEFAPNADAVTM